ncbi:extracellular solute-binding protein [Saccharopolyspora sp. K220]|uniref:ABC transporter substrate-binding protein n=1 Tax=Saccharopolyspora soli TaxID=2926618 RepID=UPI001F59E59B|nr:extracellular solute-binding protein [Saccharopolyspora soli]MCI2416143.1 extracellular solute-binding protein [Saccharopolyspora soli]
MTRRSFLQLSTSAFAVGSATALGGCGGSRSGEVVDFWAAFNRSEQEDYVQRELVAPFASSHGLPVLMAVKQTSTIDRLVQTAVASGRGPDLFPTPGPAQVLAYLDAGKLADLDAGKLADLDGYARRFDWNGKLQRWAVEASKVDGKLYSIPLEYESMVLLYNPAVFARNGWHPPRDRTDFERICTEAAARGIMPVAAGNADYKPATEWLVTVFLNHFSGPQALHDALRGNRSWTDALFVDAIELLADYFGKGWFGGGVQSYFTNRNDALYAKLASGQAAMMLTGSWGFSDAAAFFGPEAGNDARWEWAVIPSFAPTAPPELFEIAIGSSVVLNSDSPHPDAAAEYLNWRLSDPARAAKALADVGLPPPPIDIRDADYPANSDPRVRRFFTELNASSLRGYTTWTHWPPRSNNHMYRGMDRVIVGKTSAREFCAELDELFAEERAAGHVPPVPAPEA